MHTKMVKNINTYIKNRRNITEKNLNHLVGALSDVATVAQKKNMHHVANKVSLYVKALRSEKEWETLFATANNALSYVDEVNIRASAANKSWDLRGLQEGEFLPDGAIVLKCSTCGKMGLMRDDLGSQSYCAHVVIVRPAGYEIKKQCPIPPRDETEKDLV